MVKVFFETAEGAKYAVEAEAGQSLMRAAYDNNVPGIEAACGGALVCGTCHAYIGERWRALLPQQGDIEREMLDYALHARPQSRLTCQVPVTEAMDGIEIAIPPSQR